MVSFLSYIMIASHQILSDSVDMNRIVWALIGYIPQHCRVDMSWSCLAVGKSLGPHAISTVDVL